MFALDFEISDGSSTFLCLNYLRHFQDTLHQDTVIQFNLFIY